MSLTASLGAVPRSRSAAAQRSWPSVGAPPPLNLSRPISARLLSATMVAWGNLDSALLSERLVGWIGMTEMSARIVATLLQCRLRGCLRSVHFGTLPRSSETRASLGKVARRMLSARSQQGRLVRPRRCAHWQPCVERRGGLRAKKGGLL